MKDSGEGSFQLREIQRGAIIGNKEFSTKSTTRSQITLYVSFRLNVLSQV